MAHITNSTGVQAQVTLNNTVETILLVSPVQNVETYSRVNVYINGSLETNFNVRQGNGTTGTIIWSGSGTTPFISGLIVDVSPVSQYSLTALASGSGNPATVALAVDQIKA